MTFEVTPVVESGEILRVRASAPFLLLSTPRHKFRGELTMTIIVYTLPECVQCETTKTYLERNNLAYSVVDLSVNPKEYEAIKLLGYDRVPVVIAGESHWSGFRPDKLFKLTRAHS